MGGGGGGPEGVDAGRGGGATPGRGPGRGGPRVHERVAEPGGPPVWTAAVDRRVAPALPSRDPRPVARVLIDAVQGAPAQAYPWEQIDPHVLLRASLTHGLTPPLTFHLPGGADPPPPLPRPPLVGCGLSLDEATAGRVPEAAADLYRVL